MTPGCFLLGVLVAAFILAHLSRRLSAAITWPHKGCASAVLFPAAADPPASPTTAGAFVRRR
jgi:hypothetical protein